MGRRDGTRLPDNIPKAPKDAYPPPQPGERRSPPQSDLKTKDDIRGKPPKQTG